MKPHDILPPSVRNLRSVIATCTHVQVFKQGICSFGEIKLQMQTYKWQLFFKVKIVSRFCSAQNAERVGTEKGILRFHVADCNFIKMVVGKSIIMIILHTTDQAHLSHLLTLEQSVLLICEHRFLSLEFQVGCYYLMILL